LKLKVVHKLGPIDRENARETRAEIGPSDLNSLARRFEGNQCSRSYVSLVGQPFSSSSEKNSLLTVIKA